MALNTFLTPKNNEFKSDLLMTRYMSEKEVLPDELRMLMDVDIIRDLALRTMHINPDMPYDLASLTARQVYLGEPITGIELPIITDDEEEIVFEEDNVIKDIIEEPKEEIIEEPKEEINDLINDVSEMGDLIVDSPSMDELFSDIPKNEELIEEPSGINELIDDSSSMDELINDAPNDNELIEEPSGIDELIDDSNSMDELIDDSNSFDKLIDDSSSMDELINDTNGFDELFNDSSNMDELFSDIPKNDELIEEPSGIDELIDNSSSMDELIDDSSDKVNDDGLKEELVLPGINDELPKIEETSMGELFNDVDSNLEVEKMDLFSDLPEENNEELELFNNDISDNALDALQDTLDAQNQPTMEDIEEKLGNTLTNGLSMDFLDEPVLQKVKTR